MMATQRDDEVWEHLTQVRSASAIHVRAVSPHSPDMWNLTFLTPFGSKRFQESSQVGLFW